MSVISLKTKQKYGTLLAGNEFFSPSAYESIATATATGSSPSITFSAIPSTYQHLQIRAIARPDNTLSSGSAYLQFNSDTGSNYAAHWLYGNGSSALATGSASRTNVWVQMYYISTGNSNTHGVGIIDIHDYASTTKNKTVRSFNGCDINGSGYINLVSGLWMNTNAITSITINFNSLNMSNTSTFALYGIKGA